MDQEGGLLAGGCGRGENGRKEQETNSQTNSKNTLGDAVTHHIPDQDGTMNTLIQCPRLQYDTNHLNSFYCHINQDQELVGGPLGETGRNNHPLKFQTYTGTCSTPLPSGPAPPQYWEVHGDVAILMNSSWWLIMEAGLCLDSAADDTAYLCLQPSKWCLGVGDCRTHRPVICTRVYRDGEQFDRCHTTALSAIPGNSAVLRYGIVFDVARGRVGFIDLNSDVVMASFDVGVQTPLSPMFSVVPLPNEVKVAVKLVTGSDVTMTDAKKKLIHKALWSNEL